MTLSCSGKTGHQAHAECVHHEAPLGADRQENNQLPSLTQLRDNAGSGGTESLYPCGAVGFLGTLLRGHHR